MSRRRTTHTVPLVVTWLFAGLVVWALVALLSVSAFLAGRVARLLPVWAWPPALAGGGAVVGWWRSRKDPS